MTGSIAVVLRLLVSVLWLLLVLLHAPLVRAHLAQRVPLPRGGEAEAAEAEPSPGANPVGRSLT